MRRALLLAAGLALTATTTHAQPCLTLSDGLGTTTVTCPDGRSGVLHTDPQGGVAGMIGGQPYSGTALGLDPVGQTSGAPSTAYLTAPPPPSISAPQPQPPSPPATLEPLTPQTELTSLQQQYLAEQQSLRLRRAQAARAAQPAKPAPVSPAAAPGRTRRPAGSGPSGGNPG